MIYNLDKKKEYIKKRESVLRVMKDILEIYTEKKDESWLELVKKLGSESVRLKEKLSTCN